MNKSLFYFDKPNKWDLATIFIYFGLTIFIFLTDISTKKDWVLIYSIGTHLFIYAFNYRSLRKLNIWLIWFVFSLVHIFLYQEFVNDPTLQVFRGPAAHGLRSTWILLILFQVLRFISIKVQNRDLVAPSKRRTDIWDERVVTPVDFALFVVYILMTVILTIA